MDKKSDISIKDRMWAMSVALDEANKAYDTDEVPVGACIVDSNGKIVSTSFNSKEKEQDPCGHAEINVIKKLSKEINSWRLSGYHLVVTLEPCVMCAGAIMNARFNSVSFGAYDPKGGFLSLGYNVNNDEKLNHSFKVYGGIRQHSCSRILSQFFKQRRKTYKFSSK